MTNNDIIAVLEKTPASGISAKIDTVYLYNPDAVNALVEELNVILEKLGGLSSINNYRTLENLPKLVTNEEGPYEPSSETIFDSVFLHKISKTGNYADLLNKPVLGLLSSKDKILNADIDANAEISKDKFDSSVQASLGKADTALQASDIQNLATKEELANESTARQDADSLIRTSLNDHISNTENPHSVTKDQVGLGNVDNTSDEDKPVSTAQREALEQHNEDADAHSVVFAQYRKSADQDIIDNQIKQSITDETNRAIAEEQKILDSSVQESVVPSVVSSVSLVQTDSSVSIKSVNKNTNAGTTSDETFTIQNASSTKNGLMTKEAYNKIEQNSADIETLKGSSKRYPVRLGEGPFTQQDYQEAWERESGSAPGSIPPDGTTLINLDTNHAITYYANLQQDHWVDRGVDTVTVATNEAPGIVLGSASEDGKIFVEQNGSMSVNGWDDLTNKVDDHISDSTRHITAEERSTWNSKQNALTPAQVSAVDSGITSEKVALYDSYETEKADKTYVDGELAKKADITSLAPVALSGNYSDLNGRPTKISDLEDDTNTTPIDRAKSDALGNDIASTYARKSFNELLYLTRTGATTANLTNDKPALNPANYLTTTTTNTTINWSGTQKVVISRTTQTDVTLDAYSAFTVSLAYAISRNAQIEVGARVLVNGQVISSQQIVGSRDLQGNNNYDEVYYDTFVVLPDLLTAPTTYPSGSTITIELFKKQANGQSLTTRIYCGVTQGGGDRYSIVRSNPYSVAIGSNQIQDGAITTSKIADLAVTGEKIATGSITSSKISDYNITATKLADDSVETNKIKDGSVTEAKLDSATQEKINNTLNQENITNCILEIPQDIKLELAEDGTLTLKAGSKVYVPNGAGVFNEVTLSGDRQLQVQNFGESQGILVLCDFDDYFPFARTWSGDTQPTVSANTNIWYDTANNQIKYTNNAGATWHAGNISLPIAIVSMDSTGKITSIDQVFNGFGFIGNTVFSLPGLQVAVPNGINEDGTLNNNVFTTDKVFTTSTSNNILNAIGLYKTGIGNRFGYYVVDTYSDMINLNKNGFYYVVSENKMYSLTSPGGNVYENFAIVCYANNVSNKITDLKTKYAFRAVDYSDYKQLEGIEDGSVTNSMLANASITTIKIADDAVSPSAIQANAVTTPKIANGAITEEKLDTDYKAKVMSTNSFQEITAGKVFMASQGTQYKSTSRTDVGKIYMGTPGLYIAIAEEGGSFINSLTLGPDAVTIAKVPEVGDSTSSIITSNWIARKFKTVASLPASPDPNTFYFITE